MKKCTICLDNYVESHDYIRRIRVGAVNRFFGICLFKKVYGFQEKLVCFDCIIKIEKDRVIEKIQLGFGFAVIGLFFVSFIMLFFLLIL